MTDENNAERLKEKIPEETSVKKSTETSGAKVKESNSLTGVLNAKIVALAIVGIVVGILIGQVVLPGFGIGLIASSGPEVDEGLCAVPANMTAVQAKVLVYLEENFEPQGITVEISTFEDFSDGFYLVDFTLSKDGQDKFGEVYVSKDGMIMLSGQVINLDEPIPIQPDQPVQPTDPIGAPTVGTFESFNDSGYEIELQDGKPVIRLFSTTWCPHCQWVKDTFDAVMNEYVSEGKIVAYHWEVDTGDNTLTSATELEVPASELAVYQHFNPGGSIPTFVFGGKYHRIGNSFEQEDDLVAEAAEFRTVIDSLIAEANAANEVNQ